MRSFVKLEAITCLGQWLFEAGRTDTTLDGVGAMNRSRAWWFIDDGVISREYGRRVRGRGC